MKLHYAIVYLYPSYLYSYTLPLLYRQTNTDSLNMIAGMLYGAHIILPQHRGWLEPARAPCRGLPKDFADVGEHAGRGGERRTSLHGTRATAAAGLGGRPRVQVVRGAAGRATRAREQVLNGGGAVRRSRARSQGAVRCHCVRAEGLALGLVALHHPAGLPPCRAGLDGRRAGGAVHYGSALDLLISEGNASE